MVTVGYEFGPWEREIMDWLNGGDESMVYGENSDPWFLEGYEIGPWEREIMDWLNDGGESMVYGENSDPCFLDEGYEFGPWEREIMDWLKDGGDESMEKSDPWFLEDDDDESKKEFIYVCTKEKSNVSRKAGWGMSWSEQNKPKDEMITLEDDDEPALFPISKLKKRKLQCVEEEEEEDHVTTKSKKMMLGLGPHEWIPNAESGFNSSGVIIEHLASLSDLEEFIEEQFKVDFEDDVVDVIDDQWMDNQQPELPQGSTQGFFDFGDHLPPEYQAQGRPIFSIHDWEAIDRLPPLFCDGLSPLSDE